MNSDFDFLERALHPLRLRYPSLLISWEEEKAVLGVTGHETEITIERSEGRWNVYTAEWHGHHKSPEDATETAELVLSGKARPANQFREDELASAWLEVGDANSFLKKHESFYLMPFDRDEWSSLPGEKWKVGRRTRALVGPEPPAIVETDKVSDSPIFCPEWMLEWMDQNYGTPAPNCKWVMDRSHRYVVQIPAGWRLQKESEPEPEWKGVAYAPTVTTQFIRIRTAFRDPDPPDISETRTSPQPSSSIEFQTESMPDWRLNRWIAYFANGSERMMSDVSLYVSDKTTMDEEAALVRLMRASVEVSLFVFPGNE